MHLFLEHNQVLFNCGRIDSGSLGNGTETNVPGSTRDGEENGGQAVKGSRKFFEACTELEQEHKCVENELAKVETLPEEDNVHVTEALRADWRAKRKTVGMRKGRGFQQPSTPEGSQGATGFLVT